MELCIGSPNNSASKYGDELINGVLYVCDDTSMGDNQIRIALGGSVYKLTNAGLSWVMAVAGCRKYAPYLNVRRVKKLTVDV